MRRGVARRRRLRRTGERSSGEPDQSAVSESLPLGIEAPYCWLARQGPHPNLTPQPQLVPLHEVLPYAGIPIATSDPPPWDATAVLSQPSVVTHRPPI